MQIHREVMGCQCTFELTADELFRAFQEQEHSFDCDAVRDLVYCFEDADLIESFGADSAEILGLTDDIAYEMRRQMDKYGIDMDYAREEAIRDVVGRKDRCV